eukprot:4029133-Prymnesium_polylepis.1
MGTARFMTGVWGSKAHRVWSTTLGDVRRGRLAGGGSAVFAGSCAAAEQHVGGAGGVGGASWWGELVGRVLSLIHISEPTRRS